MIVKSLRNTEEIPLYLIRHSEAYKNLNRVHGGGDQRLTTRGIRQANLLGAYLLNSVSRVSKLHVVHQPEGRSRATAAQIAAITKRPIVESKDLEGVKLGVAGGLTEHELNIRFPEVAEALQSWRTQKGSLNRRPHVPGSERMEEFALRIRRGLQTSLESCPRLGTLAIVGTTSTLNMMNHLLANDGEFRRERYDFIEFPLGSLACWQISSKPPSISLNIFNPEGEN